MKLGEIQKIYVELTNDKNFTKKPLVDKNLPMKIGFIIQNNIQRMEPIITSIDKSRQKLAEKYAVRDENGQIVSNGSGVPIADSYKFNIEYSELMETETNIEFCKFKMSDLEILEDEEKCKEYGYDKLTVGELGALSHMIEG